MPIEIRPLRLRGPWASGWALDYHTATSTFLGYDQFGHPTFDTKRTAAGELLYRLKSRFDSQAVPPLAEAAASFIDNWRAAGSVVLDALIPVPPSNTARRRQPVVEVAREISLRTRLELLGSRLRKVKKTPQLKDVFEHAKRAELLRGAFAVDRQHTEGRHLLLFDDLFRSGATASEITNLLLVDGRAAEVHLLALTQTRKNL